MFGIVTKRYTTFLEMVERDAISNGDGTHTYAKRMTKVWADKSFIKAGDSLRGDIKIWGFSKFELSYYSRGVISSFLSKYPALDSNFPFLQNFMFYL